MRRLANLALELGKAAILSYLFVFVVGLAALLIVSGVAIVTGVSSLHVSLGPVPFMSTWNSASGYGFQSEWGLGASALVGAAVGLALGLRRRQMRLA
jgi:hypothetical protein